MRNPKETHNIADQSNDKVRKSQKHDANLQKNSGLYFQVGLILCLLATYGLFELKFEKSTYNPDYVLRVLPDDTMVDAVNIIPEESIATKKKDIISEPIVEDPNLKIVDNAAPMIDEKEFLSEPQPNSDPVDPKGMGKIEKPNDINPDELFDMRDVEIVPIYPGCEKMMTNETRVKCMSEKLTRLIQNKFDTGLALELGLTGTQRINVQFKIDKQGRITDVLARAPHPELEKEAKRLTTKIPTMEPGLQRHKPVSVLYNLPIVFRVQN
jgi:protein TonB